MPTPLMIKIPLCLILHITYIFQIEIYLKSRTASSLKGKPIKLTYAKTLKIRAESLKWTWELHTPSWHRGRWEEYLASHHLHKSQDFSGAGKVGKEAELSATAYNAKPSLKTQVKTISALAHSQSRICDLFKEMSLNRNFCGPDSIQTIPHMLSRSEISSLHVIWQNTKVMRSDTCSGRKWLENLE